MSLTRKASSAAIKPTKPPRQDLAAALAEREAELVEARRQQAATAEILRVISRSKTDAAPVFETILDACQRLFGSDEIGVYTIGDDEMVRVAAWLGPRAEEVRRDVTPLADSVTGRIIRERRTHHIPDLRAEPNLSATVRERVERLGSASLLYAPMLWEDRGLGSILVARSPPRPFSEREQTLLQTFADQAAIAIENARLFHETQEALEHQKATSDVLQVISRSTFDLNSVFRTLVENAVRLCGARTGMIFQRDGEIMRLAAADGATAEFVSYVRDHPIAPGRGTVTGRAALEGRTVHFLDIEKDPEYSYGGRSLERYRSIVGVPLMRDTTAVGVFTLWRHHVEAFTPRQIALVETFADQAVIAIENARMFEETQQALERQTATADILKVIASSPTDVRPVFEAIATSANRLLGGFSTAVLRFVSDAIHLVAFTPANPTADEILRTSFPQPLAEFPPFRLVRDGETIQFADTEADHVPSLNRELARLRGYRSMLIAPLMSKGAAIGMISVTRKEPGDFAARHVQLLQTFADQAVIAIENVRLFDEVQAKTRDLEESLEQQTATADVLKAISRSAFDLETVLESLISTAMRLCGANGGQIFRRDGDIYRYAASQMLVNPTYRAHEQMAEIKAGRGTLIGRVALENRTVHIADAWNDPDYAEKEEARLGKVRAMLGVPLLRNGEPIGAFALARGEPVPFTRRQVELVTTFADQAVIAIENVRLFDEVQAKTRDLEEALRQQTATADVLKVISRSAFDLDVVFDALLASAVSLFGSRGGTICVRDGDVFRYRAVAEGRGSAMWEYLSSHPATPGRASVAGRVLLSGKPEIISDTLLDNDLRVPVHSLAGSRSIAGVPLLRDDKVEGALMVGRAEAGPFDSQQIELLQTFADQAVIAIENARLFEEVQARTRDLEESLAQQTATADVLKVISRSAFDLQAVWRTLVESASTLCEAPMGLIELLDGDVFRLAMQKGYGEAFERYLLETPLRAGSSSGTGRAASTGEVSHIPDVLQDPDYLLGEAQRLGGYRSNLAVPLLRESKVIGVFVLGRPTPGPFTERQIELVKTFADQAVIAIENVRLFDEVQARTRDLSEALQQQTATADVLKVISRSAFDLQAVLDTLVASAARLCEAEKASIFQRQGQLFHWASQFGYSEELVAYARSHPLSAGADSATARVARDRQTVHIPDVLADPDYAASEYQRLGNYRTILAVPLLREGVPIGVFIMTREAVHPFNRRQIELLQTFTDQAVIAIENARLLDEVQARTRDLEEALAQQTATADVLKVISRSMLDLDSVLQTLIDTAVRLARGSRGTIFLQRGDALIASAFHSNVNDELREYLANASWRLDGDTPPAQAAREGRAVHIPDLSKLEDENTREVRKRAPYGAGLWVPLIGERQTIGVFGVPRDEPIAFTDREIEIVKTFADQAVIAIENARLFDEVQARTKELAASLDDLRKAQDRLIQSEKLASLGQLTAGIAHEIKNPLNFVNNFSALSRELVGELADVVKAAPLDKARREEAEELIATIDGNLDKVVQHGKRANSIVKNMLLHSREGSGERSETNINTMVEEALNLAYHGMRAEKPGFNMTIVKSLDPNAGTADVYAQEMTRVLLNLISNGFYATSKRKSASGDGAYEPTITASTRDLGHSVEIAIRDNGVGIPGEVKAKMFNPFFTTKPAGEGTGLGLSLSHDIVVKQHGGTIEVSTEPGAYTRFIIVLPRAGAKE